MSIFLLGVLVLGLVFAYFFNKLPSQEGSNDNKEVSRGALLVLTGHEIGLVFMLLISSKWRGADPVQTLKNFPVWIGTAQFIYVIPLIIIVLVKKKKGIIKGILIAAGITFLLSFAMCSSMLCYPSIWR